MNLIGETGKANAYRALARSYRPQKLSELIGQDVLVRALTNAFAANRVAHAFLLTGIRGVGKTTTARIIARALNCVGPDGQGGPTPEPCGECRSCREIGEDGSLDVIEMDAATRTGIDDIREIVDNVRYAPASSRYKVYIVDEVHMLSEKAFNALLKTLEEPPPHAKFVFATTEARKVPITVLSRCQRFDLRRVEPEPLTAHLQAICEREGGEAESEALAMIAKAAEGSVRDSLSLLDQAIAMGENMAVDAASVAAMLGYGDRGQMLELLAMLLERRPAEAIEAVRRLYAEGADPLGTLQDLLELTHQLTTQKLDRKSGGEPEALAVRMTELAHGHGLEVLSRLWQMLLKGLEELRAAPLPLAAMEMLMVRLACANQLPPPGELMRLLGQAGESGAPAEQVLSDSGPTSPGVPTAMQPMSFPSLAPPSLSLVPNGPGAGGAAVPAAQGLIQQQPAQVSRPESAFRNEPQANQQPAPQFSPLPGDFEAMVAALRRTGQHSLVAFLQQSTHLVSYRPPRLAIRLHPAVPRDFTGQLGKALERLTGERWVIVVEREGGAATLAEQEQEAKAALIKELAKAPEVQRILNAVPGAKLVDVRRRPDC